MYKKIIIIAIVFLTSLVFWIAAKPWVEGMVKFSDPAVWIWPLVCLIVLVTVIGLAFALIRGLLWVIGLSVFIGIAFLLVFDFNPLYPGTFSTLILLHLWAQKTIKEELEQRTKINIGHALRRGMPWIVMPLLIMISFAYFLDPKVQSSASGRELPPTVQQTIQTTVETFLGSELKALPASQRKTAENQIVGEVTRRLTDLGKPYFKYLPPLMAFGVFLILQGLSFIFIWLAIWLGMLIFWILKRFGMVKITEKQMQAEAIEF